MNINFEVNDNQIVYVVSDCEEYKEVIESQFYTLKDNVYTKAYKLEETVDINRLKKNFSAYAEDMFKQMGYVSEVKWQQALKKFIDIAEENKIDWWLTGSAALCVRGVDTNPHDVDIMLDSKDLDRVRKLFAEYIVEPIVNSSGWVVKYFGVLFMEARIDLAFDPEVYVDEPELCDFGLYAKANLEEVQWQGRSVRVPPIELQLEVNRRRERFDRVQAIQTFMNRNKG